MIRCVLAALTLLLAAAMTGARMLRRRVAVVTVSGASMHPTLTSGDRVVVRRSTINQIRTGQIVVIERPRHDDSLHSQQLRWPPAPRGWMIKRVAAVPGEPTPAVMFTKSVRNAEPVVPPGKLVVLGDNPACSLDSRLIGYIAAEHVLGTMIRALPAGGRRRASY